MEPSQLDWFAKPDRLDLIAFESAVRQAGGWILARDLLRRAGLEDTEHARRHLRALAAQSDAILSGQRGYCHLANATPEDIHHAAAWLESQAREMMQRAVRLRRRAHSAIHTGQAQTVQRHD